MATITDLGVDSDGILMPMLMNRFRARFNGVETSLDTLSQQTVDIGPLNLMDEPGSVVFHFEVDTGTKVMKELKSIPRTSGNNSPVAITIDALDGDNGVLMSIKLEGVQIESLYIQHCPTDKLYQTRSFDYAANSSVRAEVEFYFESSSVILK
jgi:hypothetical protein